MSVAEEAARRIGRRHVATHIYYRQPNGWITSGAASLIERAKFMAEKWEPLDRYGRLDVHYPYTNNHPFEALFQRGGAEEMCVEQIIANGFWQNPPEIPGCNIAISPDHMSHDEVCWADHRTVEFPQVPVDTPKYFTCQFCPAMYNLPTEQARNQHENVAHKKEKSELRTGEALANALTKGLTGNGPKKETANAKASREAV